LLANITKAWINHDPSPEANTPDPEIRNPTLQGGEEVRKLGKRSYTELKGVTNYLQHL
jgi:hypothetical protein